jgi:hypothetical protein
MSEKEGTENVEDVQIDKESLKDSLEQAIKDEIRSQWGGFLYTIVYQKETTETGFMIETDYRIYLDEDYNIPRKPKKDNWVSEEKEAFNLFYGLGFDSFKKSKTVGRDEDENTYQLFEVSDEQVSHMMDEGYWISMDDVDFLVDIHNTELESMIRSLHSLAD